MNIALRLGALGLGLGCLPACAAESPCHSDRYPDAPAGASSVLYVATGCPVDAPDGSAARPFATIGAAVQASSPGAAIVIAPGVYAESLNLTQDLTLVGRLEESEEAPSTVLRGGPSAEAAITVTAGASTLRGLWIDAPAGAGVWAKGAAVTIDGARISGARKGPDAASGHGVLATAGASIILQRSAVGGAAGAGVFAQDSAAIILQSTIDASAAGGIILQRGAGRDPLRVEGNTLTDNHGLGVGVWNSRAIILQNTIKSTHLDASATADGLVITGDPREAPTSVTATDNHIEASGRAGVLADGAAARGIILQRNVITGSGAEAGADEPATFGAGIWLQDGAGSGANNVIADNTVTASRFVGIGLCEDTHAIILQNNTVSGTLLAATLDHGARLEMGDGIQLFEHASARILGNHVTGSGRVGLLVDAADLARSTIRSNEFRDSAQYGIILQHPLSAGIVALDDNTFGDNVVGDFSTRLSQPFLLQTTEIAIP